MLQFSINGALLASPFTLPATSGIWEEFHATWFSGSNTTATICITNQNTAFAGNDFALDDIYFGTACTSTDSVFINTTGLTSSFSTATHACSGDVDFLATGSSGNYTWDFGDGSVGSGAMATHTYALAGNYTVQLYAANGSCTDTVVQTVTISMDDLNLSFSYLQQPCGGQVDFVPGGDTAGIHYLWDLGDGTTAGTVLSSHAYPAPGTYSVTLTAQSGSCRDTVVQEIIVNAGAPLVAEAAGDTTVCAGSTVSLSVTAAAAYLWSPAIGLNNAQVQSPLASPLESTWYAVTITDAAGCTGTDSVRITVLPAPDVSASYDAGTPIDCTHLTTTLHASGAASYVWTPGVLCDDSTSANPVVSPAQTTLFIVTGSNGTCLGRDSVLVQVDQSGSVFVPNAFTPNNDGRNDIIRPLTYYGFVVESFRIFNRFGEMVFYATKASQGWDGLHNSLPADIGTYWYYLTGRDGQHKAVLLKGDIELIR